MKRTMILAVTLFTSALFFTSCATPPPPKPAKPTKQEQTNSKHRDEKIKDMIRNGDYNN